MEVIKKKIYLEDYITRASGATYGTLTAKTYYFQIFLKQEMDDMGSFTNIITLPKTNTSPPADYKILISKIQGLGITPVFDFMLNLQPTNMPTNMSPYYRTVGKTAQDYYTYYNTYNTFYNIFEIKTKTENRITDLRSYSVTKFTVGLDIENSIYTNYLNQTINGRSRVIQLTPTEIYVFDGDQNNKKGLLYENIDETLAFVTYDIQGVNVTNTVLSAITKEEYLFGITSKPEIKSDLFIDRGLTNVIERDIRISEVKNVNQLEKYQNNYFNVTRF